MRSLRMPNQRFRGIVCFQWVDPRFVSLFSSTALFPIQKHRIQRASANFHSFNALLPTCELRRTSAPVFERFRIAHNGRGRCQIWRSRRAPIQRQAALIEQAGTFSSSGQLYIWFCFTQEIVGRLSGSGPDEGGLGINFACAQAQ